MNITLHKRQEQVKVWNKVHNHGLVSATMNNQLLQARLKYIEIVNYHHKYINTFVCI